MERIKNKRTTNQHYIPKFMLKRHMKNGYIHEYNKKTGNERKLNTVKNICCYDDLYELKNELGIIYKSADNLIENNFSKLETEFGRVTKKIINEEKLNKQDYAYLYLFVCSQMLRTPEVMGCISNKILQDHNLNEHVADAITKINLFPSLSSSKTEIIFKNILELFRDYSLCILKTEESVLLNNQRPVCFLRTILPAFPKKDILLLPIAANYFVVLSETEIKEDIINVSKNDVEKINKLIFENEGCCIYSSESIKERRYLFDGK